MEPDIIELLPSVSDEEQQKHIKRLIERRKGKWQNEHGELRAETVQTFLSAFPKEVSQHLESRINHLKTIEADKRFKAEAIRLLMDFYLIGIFHGAQQPEAVKELRKRFKS